jgi:hypothetical protein
MLAMCRMCEEEVELNGAQIVKEGRGYLYIIGKDRRFHEISTGEKKTRPNAEVEEQGDGD